MKDKKTVTVDGKEYLPEDLDVNGRPYEDAKPVGDPDLSSVTNKPLIAITNTNGVRHLYLRSKSSNCPSLWPGIPIKGQYIYVRSPHTGGPIEVTVKNVNVTLEIIFLEAPYFSDPPLKMELDYIHFDQRSWSKGWTFSFTP